MKHKGGGEGVQREADKERLAASWRGSDDWQGAGLVSLEGSYTHTYAQHDCVYKGRLEQFHSVPPRRRAMCVNHERNVYIDDVCYMFFGIWSEPLRLPKEQRLFFTNPHVFLLFFLNNNKAALYSWMKQDNERAEFSYILQKTS